MLPHKTLSAIGLILATYIGALAQSETGANPFMNDSNGRPLYLKTNYASEGSPYLFEDYLPATLTTDKGEVYRNVMVKLNLVENEVLYRLQDGKEMVSTKRIYKIVMPSTGTMYPVADSLTITGINTALNSKGAITYFVYSTGKLTLLKKVSVTFKDAQEYGNTNTTRVFTRKETFYVMDQNGNTDKLPSILDLFTNKRRAVDGYVNDNKLDLWNEKHLVSVFSYYNALFWSLLNPMVQPDYHMQCRYSAT